MVAQVINLDKRKPAQHASIRVWIVRWTSPNGINRLAWRTRERDARALATRTNGTMIAWYVCPVCDFRLPGIKRLSNSKSSLSKSLKDR